MPDVHGSTQGNQYVRIMLQVPSRLTAEQKRLLKEFAETTEDKIQEGNNSFTEKIKKVFK